MARDTAEEIFEQYLNNLEYKFDYESNKGVGKKPDYLVYAKQEFLAEVKSFYENDLYLDTEKQLKETGTAQFGQSSDDLYRPIREKINIAQKQLKPNAQNRPTLVVLFCLEKFRHIIDISNRNLFFSIYGNEEWVLSKENTTIKINPKKAKVGPKRNTTISAVAVIEKSGFDIPPRLRIIHNYFTKAPFDFDTFSSNDEHIYFDKSGQLVGKI
jgi:hypothetical protein